MITEELDLDRDLMCSEPGLTVGIYGDSSLSFTHSRSLTQAFNKEPRKARLAKFSPPESGLQKSLLSPFKHSWHPPATFLIGTQH